MTVKELKSILDRFPDNLNVVIEKSEWHEMTNSIKAERIYDRVYVNGTYDKSLDYVVLKS